MNRPAAVIGIVLACGARAWSADPPLSAVEGPKELRPARLYLAGQRAEAVSALSGRGALELRLELGKFRQLVDVHEPLAGALLRSGIMLHTDRASIGRAQAPVSESPRVCGIGDDDVLARSIASYALAREDSRAFARRWFAAMAWQSQWNLCLDDVREWTREGLKWFPKDPELWLAKGVALEAIAQTARVDSYGADLVGAARAKARLGRDLDEALAAYRAALQEAPDLLEARLRLGRTLWRREKLDEAGRELAQVARDAREPSVLYLAQLFLARVHDDAGRAGDAAQAYRAALAAEPAGQAAALGLAELQARTGDVALSRATVALALAAAPRSDTSDPYMSYHLGPAGRGDAVLDALRQETLQ